MIFDATRDEEREPGDRGRRERYIRTHSGVKFFPWNPDAESICCEDVVCSLSEIRRFCGHTSRPYTVGEHTVLVCRLAEANGEPQSVVDACAIHDAPEAYIGDVASPLKALLMDYQEIESGVAAAVSAAFRTDAEDPRVKKYDRLAIWIEANELMPDFPEDWEEFAPTEGDVLVGLPGEDAYRDELKRRVEEAWANGRAGRERALRPAEELFATA